MFKKRMIGKRASREIIFEAKIDFNNYGPAKGKHLSLDNIDKFRGHDNYRDKKHNFQTAVNRAITTDLPADLKNIYGISVQTRVIEWREGSILIFFGAVISGISLFANYADFFDSINLVKEHLKSLLRHILVQDAVDDDDDNTFAITINNSFPHLPNPHDFNPRHLIEKWFHIPYEELEHHSSWFQNSNSHVPKHNGFIWYLLIMNIILLVIIGLLVGAAVVKTYFP